MANRHGHQTIRTIYHPRWIILFLLACISACDHSIVVISELSERDANIALVMLRDNHIDAQKEVGSSKKVAYQIKVRKAQAEDALRLLVYNQLPAVNRAGLKEIYPPGSQSLIPTKTDESARLTMAMQGEIEAMLKMVPGISDAHVIFSADPTSIGINSPIRRTASVTVVFRPHGQSHEPPLGDQEIRKLISSSIGGIEASDVVVVQKMIRPTKFLGLREEPPSEALRTMECQHKDSSQNSFWFLLTLTLVAMTIAAYSVARSFFPKRELS